MSVSGEFVPCWKCDGHGCEEGCGWRGGCQMAHAGPGSHKVCRGCGGSGSDLSGGRPAS